MKALVVYASRTGNTEQLAMLIKSELEQVVSDLDFVRIEDFHEDLLSAYQACVIVTYTWGNGDVPEEMNSLYKAIEQQPLSSLVTGIAGTGDQCYPYFCGAVDQFRDMLYVHTKLSVTLKVELSPQQSDAVKCRKFAEKMIEKVNEVTAVC
ncbi:flavodoxin domain-containing protein [Jeotgalibacillus haloalkalitolerans]|uniref:Flavodoxin domain-containing protein n=1 Tax=Jeotgalibacillus haloalkalitolerans TaxID=3104292 RepID=A0ABU5KQ05_9BACL|nr:flavodoxin domain-containing protein [Jeotgalibacillus sp. HH7-29]MDZ5712831.1 flavodoxin domain-containing protein [Jeotgalibacillus sp. HH7-29]